MLGFPRVLSLVFSYHSSQLTPGKSHPFMPLTICWWLQSVISSTDPLILAKWIVHMTASEIFQTQLIPNELIIFLLLPFPVSASSYVASLNWQHATFHPAPQTRDPVVFIPLSCPTHAHPYVKLIKRKVKVWTSVGWRVRWLKLSLKKGNLWSIWQWKEELPPQSFKTGSQIN